MIPRALRRAAFWAFAALVVTATHWPGLAAPNVVERSDLYVHVLAWSAWTALLVAAEYTGPFADPAAVLRAQAIALAVAVLDESTQALPGVNRHVALDDMLANAAGVLAGGLACAAVAAIWRRVRLPSTRHGA